jgi:UDP-glucose 4-epimerase
MSICLVTGGAGFIGSHLVEALLANGHEVRVLENFSTGNLANLANVSDRIELRTGDVADLDAVREAMHDVERVFHLAANPSIVHSLNNPLATHQTCASGTLNVLVAAHEARVQRVVYSASAACYGEQLAGRCQETDPLYPMSPYAVSVLAAEHYCAAFTAVYGLETVRLRCFNVFGPRQSSTGSDASVVPLFIQAALAGRRPIVLGDGLQARDFIDVDDVVQANLLAAEAPRVSGRVYNIGTGQATSILDLLKAINFLAGCGLKPIHAPARPSDARHSQADIARAQADLGYCPCTDMERSLRRCIDFYSERCGSAAFVGPTVSKVG